MDCSITKRRGCNYCLRDKSIPLSNEDYSVYINVVDEETKHVEIDFGNGDIGTMMGCYVPINYCPMCGREL